MLKIQNLFSIFIALIMILNKQENIRLLLSYITLTYSDSKNPKKITDKKRIINKNRLSSQEGLVDILNICF